jgi:cytochrome c oxidase subunit I
MSDERERRERNRRRCLRVRGQAERLIKFHAVSGALAILLGGIAAVLVLLTRWPAVYLLDPVYYYRA